VTCKHANIFNLDVYQKRPPFFLIFPQLVIHVIVLIWPAYDKYWALFYTSFVLVPEIYRTSNNYDLSSRKRPRARFYLNCLNLQNNIIHWLLRFVRIFSWQLKCLHSSDNWLKIGKREIGTSLLESILTNSLKTIKQLYGPDMLQNMF
jgi:hypothetical protein